MRKNYWGLAHKTTMMCYCEKRGLLQLNSWFVTYYACAYGLFWYPAGGRPQEANKYRKRGIMTTATAVLSPLSASPIRMLAISGQKLQDEALSNERQFSRSQFIFYQAPARTSASFHLPPISSISSLVGIFATGKHIATPINHNRERFRQDIVSLLPPEIGVKIFEYLRPMDLCQ